MKTTFLKLSAIIILFSTDCVKIYGQETSVEDKACELILQEGLYRYYELKRTNNFQQDLKTYFSSDEFKKEFREGEWGGKLGVVVDGVPLELGASASDNQLTEFQQKISEVTTLGIVHGIVH